MQAKKGPAPSLTGARPPVASCSRLLLPRALKAFWCEFSQFLPKLSRILLPGWQGHTCTLDQQRTSALTEAEQVPGLVRDRKGLQPVQIAR